MNEIELADLDRNQVKALDALLRHGQWSDIWPHRWMLSTRSETHRTLWTLVERHLVIEHDGIYVLSDAGKNLTSSDLWDEMPKRSGERP
jgi:hypothetical protein